VCDLETSRIGAPYIYDIRSLRVNVCVRSTCIAAVTGNVVIEEQGCKYTTVSDK